MTDREGFWRANGPINLEQRDITGPPGERKSRPLLPWLGQPFTITIVPLSVVATAGLLREQQADGSALFNIMRNLGDSVGTALLSTMITQREQFHDFRIGERVTPYSPYVQQFLSNQSAQNLQHSGDPAGPLQQAYRMLQASVQTNVLSWHIANAFWRLA